MADPQTTDPYAATAIKAAPAQDPYAATAIKPTAQAPKTASPPPAPEGFFHSLGSAFGITTEAGQQRQQEMDQHPIRTILKDALLGPALPFAQGLVNQGKQTMGEISQAVQQGQKGDAAGIGTHLVNAVPIAGPLMTKASTNAPVSTGNYWQDVRNAATDPSTMGTLLGMSAQLAPMAEGPLKAMGAMKPLGKVASAISDAPRRLIAGDVLKPITDEGGITPLQRYGTAKGLGVNLDAAAATNGTIPKVARFMGKDSLSGGPTYDANKAANSGALSDATTSQLGKMSPLDAEAGGNLISANLRDPFIDQQNQANDLLHEYSPLEGEAAGAQQQALAKTAMDRMHNEAQQGYSGVSDNYGNLPANDTPSIVRTAKEIGAKNSRFEQQSPSLSSQRMANVIGDAAQLGNEDQLRFLGQPTVGDLIRNRSGLLDLIRDPEIVKSSYGGDIQRLIQAHDNAIMNSLPEDGREDWRAANEKWESMKNTFDNSQNPFYSAVRTPNPSTLASGIGSHTPEAARTLGEINGPQGLGIARRGVAEGLMGRTPTGEYDLSNLGSRMMKEPAEYLSELFGPGQENLQGLATDAQEIEPFRKAAYTPNPESLVRGVGDRSASAMRDLAPRIGPEGVGAIQRGTAEQLLGTDKHGQFNFPTFGRQLQLMPDAYRSELFGEHEQPLKNIATTANALDFRPNPSGTAGINLKHGEMAEGGAAATGLLMGHPAPLVATGLYHGSQYAAARLMNSPAFVDWLMTPNAKPMGNTNPFTSAAALANQNQSRQ